MSTLRQEADRAAQLAMHDMTAYIVRHGGKRNVTLEDAYRAAERVLDAVEEFEVYQEAAKQAADDESPDYFGIFMSESEARLMDGNR